LTIPVIDISLKSVYLSRRRNPTFRTLNSFIWLVMIEWRWQLAIVLRSWIYDARSIGFNGLNKYFTFLISRFNKSGSASITLDSKSITTTELSGLTRILGSDTSVKHFPRMNLFKSHDDVFPNLWIVLDLV
jgi:hypothetical protein